MTFDSFLHALGLRPRDITHGKWIRCATEAHPRKKNGCFKLADSGTIGWAIDWATMSEPDTWRQEQSEYRPVDRSAIEAARKIRIQEESLAMLEAQQFWAKCRRLIGGHPYLEKKGLPDPVHGLKVDDNNNLSLIHI